MLESTSLLQSSTSTMIRSYDNIPSMKPSGTLQSYKMYLYQPHSIYLPLLTIYRTKSLQNPYVIIKRTSVVILLQSSLTNEVIDSKEDDIGAGNQWCYVYCAGILYTYYR